MNATIRSALISSCRRIRPTYSTDVHIARNSKHPGFCYAALLLLFFLIDARAAELSRRKWTVNGVVREALVHVPTNASQQACPVVFAFHGHGGTMRHAARTFAYHTLWPEAIVVYMQGLNIPGTLSDPAGKRPGWQNRAGIVNDRDLKFFDAVLGSLKKDYQVTEKRVYATGHSNGGGFTFLLWALRGQHLAAVAPSGAFARPAAMQWLKPKPVLHVAGENDTLVKFSSQKETMEGLRQLNRCGEGQPWDKWCTFYPSKTGTPTVTFIHPGGHEFPAGAAAAIVKFFKEVK